MDIKIINMKRLIIFLEVMLFYCYSFSQKRIAIPELSLNNVSVSDSIRKILIESKCFKEFQKQRQFYGDKF